MAVAWNDDLRVALMAAANRRDRLIVTDLGVLGANRLAGAIFENAALFVVLWDGFADALALRNVERFRKAVDVTLLTVGRTALETQHSLPNMPLFPAQMPDQDAGAVARVMCQFSTLAAARFVLSGLKSLVMPLKNVLVNPQAAVNISRARNKIVFCGVVHPSSAQLENLLRSSKLIVLMEEVMAVSRLAWSAWGPEASRAMAATVARARALVASEPHELQSFYGIFNLLVRNYVLAGFARGGQDILLAEYGYDKNFNPYATPFYRRHLFLDFGSQIGYEPIYPRSAELLYYGKQFIDARPIRTDEEWRGLVGLWGDDMIAQAIEATWRRAKTAVDQLIEETAVCEKSQGMP